MKNKKPIVFSTGAWVTMYTIGFMILTLVYSLPRILMQFLPVDTATKFAIWIGESATMGIPLEIFSWGLLALTSLYAGIDRAAMATKTSMMEIGSADMGDPAKLRKTIYLIFIVFIETVILNFLFNREISIPLEYTAGEVTKYAVYGGLNLSLEGISSALVSCITIYVAGNKAIRLTQNIDATKDDQDWANEHIESVTIKGQDFDDYEK